MKNIALFTNTQNIALFHTFLLEENNERLFYKPAQCDFYLRKRDR